MVCLCLLSFLLKRNLKERKKIYTIFKRVSGLKISNMSHEDLKELRYCYYLLNSTSDVLQIDAILNKITKITNV